jgi:hypothetical protein
MEGGLYVRESKKAAQSAVRLSPGVRVSRRTGMETIMHTALAPSIGEVHK